MSPKQKLELTWVGKGNRPRLEPRILLENVDKSYHAAHLGSDDIFDNTLIHGDNLLALRALEQGFSGKVKCVFIDPPYNTGSALEHYDDGLEHSIWLSLMRDRLEILRRLLRDDGFFCCHIDDSEGAYLKVLCDEVFGRSNYLATIFIQVRFPSKTLKQDMNFHKEIEQIHVYRKDYGAEPALSIRESSFDKFSFYVDELGVGKEIELGGKRVLVFPKGLYKIEQRQGSELGLKEIWATGTILDGNSSGRFFRDYLTGRAAIDGLGALYKVYGIGDDNLGCRYFTGPNRATATKGKYFQGVPRARLDASGESGATVPIENFYNLAANFGNCRHEGGVEFRSGKKPEALLEIMLRHFSAPGDIVLDSFAGSGTTGAVAHKMRRRWIMVELGEQCYTHIVPRLRGVVDGTDDSGITRSAAWKGGGGFRYYELAPSLLEKDKWGREIISKKYNAAMLTRALCALEGFIYDPSPELYWKQGRSSERDFLYVTTQTLGPKELAALSEDVGAERSLMVLCTAFKSDAENWPNLTVRKIPNHIQNRCEWGHDDYSLNIANLQTVKTQRQPSSQPGLFDSGYGS